MLILRRMSSLIIAAVRVLVVTILTFLILNTACCDIFINNSAMVWSIAFHGGLHYSDRFHL